MNTLIHRESSFITLLFRHTRTGETSFTPLAPLYYICRLTHADTESCSVACPPQLTSPCRPVLPILFHTSNAGGKKSLPDPFHPFTDLHKINPHERPKRRLRYIKGEIKVYG